MRCSLGLLILTAFDEKKLLIYTWIFYFTVHDRLLRVDCTSIIGFIRLYFCSFVSNTNGISQCWRVGDLTHGRVANLEYVLTHWGRVTHICVGNLTTIASDNGLSPDWRQAIVWTNAGILLIGPLGINFSEISMEIQTFSFRKMRLKTSSAKWRPSCLGLNVLIHCHCHWKIRLWYQLCRFQPNSRGKSSIKI